MAMELTKVVTPVQTEILLSSQSHIGMHRSITQVTPVLKPFVESNTQNVSLTHLKDDCIVPVFTKDNEMTLSHQIFIETVWNCIAKFFSSDALDPPEIRVSHQIKGRTPDALHIPANDLQDHQKTSYFERMAFIVRVPGVTEYINGNKLSLTIGGVRSYNLENLYNKKSPERFKVFIGFQNMVCCNLCISTDGFKQEIRALNQGNLEENVMHLIQNYNVHKHLKELKDLTEHTLTEKQFAQFLGKSKLYHYLPKSEKVALPELLLNDGHLNVIAKDYYADKSFCRNDKGNINLWNVYNLFTGANKGSYIDTFLNRGVNAFNFTQGIRQALSSNDSIYSWFLS